MLIPVSTAVLVQVLAQQALLAKANKILEYINASSIREEAFIFYIIGTRVYDIKVLRRQKLLFAGFSSFTEIIFT
ncbi:hypothetical protein [Clostridium sp. chh4-2]|uniref:hypothetical protein n=1 Tax=Clostridium sp. chh4-2 TaxID=2067550 RepID=UPI0015E18352|nr:hypothetical protein [Clostridium sp. chh4-2]